MLAAGGIETEIKVLSRSKFITELKNARFMYIGQVDVAPDFDFTFCLHRRLCKLRGFPEARQIPSLQALRGLELSQ